MRFRTALTLLGACLLLLVLPAAGSATSVYGSISGTISLDGQLGTYLCATAYDGDTAVGFANTDSSGNYQLTSLPPAQYTVKFDDCGPGYTTTEWFSHSRDRQGAVALTVNAGEDTGGINGALASGGRVLGHVQTAGGSPLHGICVHADNLSGPGTSDTTTDANGNYMLTGVRPGQTRIWFRGCAAGNYVLQYYSGATAPADATPISVSAWQNKTGIDAVMIAAGNISGHVQNADGVPLQNFCVVAGANGNDIAGAAVTDAGGNYTIGEMPPSGTYKVTVRDCWNGAYLTQDQTGTLVAPPGTTYVDLTMQPAATIAGTVMDAVGNGLAEVCISAKEQATGLVTPGWTRLDGGYDIGQLTPGAYDVTFQACNANSFLIPVTDQGVAAPAGGRLQLDATLVAGGKVSGTVRGGGVPLGDVCVSSGGAHARTGADGAYTLGPIPSGTYTVTFTAKDCAAGDWESASVTGVSITAGQTAAGVDATLRAVPAGDGAPATPGSDPGGGAGSSDPPAGPPQSQPQQEPTAHPSGTAGCKVPKLKGKTLKKARSLLKKAHCATGKVARKKAKGHKGTVVRTKQKPGTLLEAGTKVAFVVVR